MIVPLRKSLVFILALVLCASALDARKEKKPKPPTQDDITEGCITISHIYSHSLSILSGVGAPQPGLEGIAFNACDGPVDVFLTIAYLGRGVQFNSGIVHQTVAPQANWQFYHEANLNGLDRGRMKLAKIIKVQAFQK